jgi:cardiolipin synthase
MWFWGFARWLRQPREGGRKVIRRTKGVENGNETGYGRYFQVHGINRKQIAAKLHYVRPPMFADCLPHHPVLAAVADPERDLPFVPGNAAELLVNGVRFFPVMLDAMRTAQRSITLETFIWRPGKISNEFIEIMCERARAGVKVHVLVDGLGSGKFAKEDRERLESAGVDYTKYHRRRPWQLKANINHRTHRKILVVDGRVGFTGGFCIDDLWLGDAESTELWRETQIRLTGPVVAQLQAAFAVNWKKTTGHWLEGDEYFPALDSTGAVLGQCTVSGPGEGARRTECAYLNAIDSARHRIDLANAYFIPDDRVRDALIAACGRGVHLRIIAPAINDSRFGRAAARSRFGPLLAAGAEMHLYHAAMYHAKTMAVDDAHVIVGSANCDHRSFRLNDEVLACLEDANLAAGHRRMFEHDLRRAHRLTREEFERRPWYIKFADYFAGLFRWFL